MRPGSRPAPAQTSSGATGQARSRRSTCAPRPRSPRPGRAPRAHPAPCSPRWRHRSRSSSTPRPAPRGRLRGPRPPRRFARCQRAVRAHLMAAGPQLLEQRAGDAGVLVGRDGDEHRVTVPSTHTAPSWPGGSAVATTLIALIRGINVGPSKRVAMADLRELLTGLGYSDVRTHLQSGNAVFSTGAKPATVGAEIEDALADRVGVRASVVVRTGRQLT